jgi:hypothetical protein
MKYGNCGKAKKKAKKKHNCDEKSGEEAMPYVNAL